MTPTWKALLGLVAVFILGCIFGGMATILFVQHKELAALRGGPNAVANALERRTTRGLNLTPDQKLQIHALLVDYLRQRTELQKQLRPQIKQINQNTLRQINALLSPDQQTGFQSNLLTIQDRLGHNPFNVGSDEPLVHPALPQSLDSGTNVPAAGK